MRALLFAAFTLPFIASCSAEVGLPESGATPAADGVVHPMPHVLVPFPDWCSSWQLDCPTGEAPDVPFVPAEGAPWTKARWRAATSAFGAVLASPSEVRLRASDLADTDLQAVVTAFGAGEALTRWRERIAAAGLSDVAIGRGTLELKAGTTASITTTSGLVVEHGPQVVVRPQGEGTLAVRGLALGSAVGSAAPVAMTQFAVTGVNALEWRSADEHRYLDVPIAFLANEALGVDLTAAPAPADDDGFATVLEVVKPLTAWLTRGTRDVVLDAQTFGALSTSVPALVDDAPTAATVGRLLAQLTRLESTAASRVTHLVKGAARREVECQINAEALLFIEPTFALKALEAVSGSTLRIRLEGFRAKPLKGLVRPNVRLSTIDVSATKIVIRDLPVIGSYTIDLDDPDNQEFNLTCAE